MKIFSRTKVKHLSYAAVMNGALGIIILSNISSNNFWQYILRNDKKVCRKVQTLML